MAHAEISEDEAKNDIASYFFQCTRCQGGNPLSVAQTPWMQYLFRISEA